MKRTVQKPLQLCTQQRPIQTTHTFVQSTNSLTRPSQCFRATFFTSSSTLFSDRRFSTGTKPGGGGAMNATRQGRGRPQRVGDELARGGRGRKEATTAGYGYVAMLALPSFVK